VSRWLKGEATIERLLADGELQTVTGAQADGQPWIAKARRTSASAAELTDTDPDSAYVLAYDAARFACLALLTHQGLRPHNETHRRCGTHASTPRTVLTTTPCSAIMAAFDPLFGSGTTWISSHAQHVRDSWLASGAPRSDNKVGADTLTQ
jgi:hypothetical protein